MRDKTTTTRYLARLPALLVLTGAIALLQLHAIQFWTEFVGPMGWAWAVLLEVVALWLWYQRQLARRALALVTSVLALTGPVYTVCEPLVEEWQMASHVDAGRELRIERLTQEALRLEESLATFRENSEVRAGWLAPIQESQARLTVVDSELAELMATPPAESMTWRQQALVAMQALALIIFQLSAVLAITSLSRMGRPTPAPTVSGGPISSGDRLLEDCADIGEGVAEPCATSPEDISCNLESRLGKPGMNETNDESELGKGHFEYANILALRESLEQLLQERGITQAAFCRDHGVSPRDLSLLRRHEARSAKGERTISITALERLATIIDAQSMSRAAT
ncbi:helix-turn-helix domain-containing protein [Halomonas cupida]|uniref:helix-turn-helix domain-containing protein n=1 Tax=Halomonas cupida TaxID=44933 RepID=UPI003EF9A371